MDSFRFMKINISTFWKYFIIGAFLSITIALFLWLPQFGQLPSGLNRDEAALGYNAYSILKTGKDEWGDVLPISITSFGDQKLPGYVYTLIPFIGLFGLESWVVRLPSLIAGLITIICLGLIAIKVARKFSFSSKNQLRFSWIAMIISATSPWHMHFSRVAYETHLAMSYFLVGITCLLYSIDYKKQIIQRILLILSGISLSATLLIYHSYQVFIPLFVLMLLFIFRKKITKLDKTGITVGIIIFIITVGLLYFGGVIRANSVKSKGITPFSDQSIQNSILLYWPHSRLPGIFSRLIFNKNVELVSRLSKNYLQTISPRFFFINGSGHGDHNPGNNNNLQLILAPFLTIGLLYLINNRKNKYSKILLAWLFLSLLPSALTTNPNLEVRIATVFPVLELISALGLMYVLVNIKMKHIAPLLIFFGVVLFISTYKSCIFYTKIAPPISKDNNDYHLLAKTIEKYKSGEDNIVTQSPSSSPYIWYLFENKVDPIKVQSDLQHYPKTEEGFIHVSAYQNIFFETVNWEDLRQRAQQNSFILIFKPEEIPQEKRLDPAFSLKEVIRDANGGVIYEVWRYSL